MVKKRYTDTEKLITNIDKLVLTDAGEVLIYYGDKWYGEVTVILGGKKEKFEKLKPMIAYVAENLWKIDMMAQRYDTLYGDGNFVYNYEVAYISLNTLDEIRVRYYGIQINTEFDVVFQCVNDEFLLKGFGIKKNIRPLPERREAVL